MKNLFMFLHFLSAKIRIIRIILLNLQHILRYFMKYTKKKLLLYIAFGLFFMTGCTNRQRPLTVNSDGFNYAEGFNHADSIISAVGDARNNPRLLAVVDSLERAGELSLAKSIFYRTITYNIMGQNRASLRLYSKLNNIDVKTLATQSDLMAYLYSYNNYVRMLCEIKRYDRALREANAADRKLKAAGYDSFTDHHDIAQTIGECQLYLGQFDLAAESYRKSLKGVHTRLSRNHDPLDYRECQKTLNAIVMTYLQTGYYAEAVPYVAVLDSLFEAADTHPQRDSVFIDEMKADINYSKALLAQAQGRPDDAERAFAVYQSTNTAQKLGNVIASGDYLIRAHRYAEAAHNYEQLDHYLLSCGFKADFDNFGRYMMPKFRANLLAGRRDSAVRVAMVVAQYYDSAFVRQRRIDSDLLTTFYDTEGKERQIAEQRAELSQQRLLTVAIVLGAFIIFFFVYTYQRRRAYRKLDDTNRQLMLANARAEESSRMKTKFIQQISHEVRTPLNVLSGFSQVLGDSAFDLDHDEIQVMSHKIVENSDRITKLIGKMLDLSVVYSNSDLECKDLVTPADVAKQAVKDSGIREASHLDFQLQLSPEAEALSILTHRRSAVKALSLLLDNAMKFTHPLVFKNNRPDNQPPHAVLNVSVSGEQVVFAVEDTGIGVPVDEAENIFTEFVQLDEFYDGTGIGLPIARSLARKMGGDVSLDTAYTGGARFVMWLPLQKA